MKRILAQKGSKVKNNLGYNILMKKTIVFILVLISIFILLIRFADFGLQSFLGAKKVSGINILSMPSGATVFLDGVEAGKTPYEDKNLTPKEYAIKIEKADLIWQGRVKLTVGTVTAISRDLAKDFSSPDGAQVEVDGKPYGITPVSLKLGSGDYMVVLSRPGYLKRSIRINLSEGYRLVVSVDLALSEADLTAVQTPPITQTPEVVVKDTPTGFLRVRDKPALSGKEIAQVKPSDTLILLEELVGWYRVRLANGTEGYVSTSYVDKKPQEKPL